MDKFSPTDFFFDLATEAAETLRGDTDREIPGITEHLRKGDHFSVSHIEIFNEEGAKSLRRPQGNYITLQWETTYEQLTAKESLIAELAKIIAGLLPSAVSAPLLLCGIGNPQLASDALGAKTVAYTFPTRQLTATGFPGDPKNFRSVATVAPNVLGNTGIETAELLRSLVKTVKPAAVIAVDALATASLNRLGNSFQCTDTGIFPGGGVHNQRKEISLATMGVPVIAIGVPTVIYPFAIVEEAFHLISEKRTQKETATSFDKEVTAENLYRQVAPQLATLAVTPKDIDYLVKEAAKILASALAIAFHPGITVENYREYLSY